MHGSFDDTLVNYVVEQSGFKIISIHELPARDPKYFPVPSRLNQHLKDFINQSHQNGLYSHQAKAINACLDGNDICLSTSTASGKSLIFMSAAANLLLNNPSAKVLALYPMRALIQDQIGKWESILNSLNIKLGHIDGGVQTGLRPEILKSCSVVLMTPDVVHAWLMSHLRDREVSTFMANLKLLILDEAHVYEGVFGTNMAYFLRRFQIAAGSHQIICSTATLGRPDDFINKLTGRKPILFDNEVEGSTSQPKKIFLIKDVSGKTFEGIVSLLVGFAKAKKGRFLAFGDSRKMVEQIVAAIHRNLKKIDDNAEEDDSSLDEDNVINKILDITSDINILPYRSGYEDDDRQLIQEALSHGHLSGVVSTSALELGLDIGEIDLIVMLNQPPSLKAFWQRLGRTGRKNPGTCIIVDNRGTIADDTDGLTKYLEKPIEPNWLYLENRYIQYTNALCAAFEINDIGFDFKEQAPFATLPKSFKQFLENEINPTEIVPSDLYPLKQRAQGSPHREFPIRSGIEQSFQVKINQITGLGSLSFSQALREAYPGAIYHYMARPYRVSRFNYRNGEIHVKREKHWTTRPLSQTMVFPRFQGGILKLFRSDKGFLAETEMQVSERVKGFKEQRGPVVEDHFYGPTSPYYQHELNRFFETTGVCWCFEGELARSEKLAQRILEVFCIEFGIEEHDIGTGLFFSKQSPFGNEECRGVCIFDSTNGSLRLTQSLTENIERVLDNAIIIATTQKNYDGLSELTTFLQLTKDLRPIPTGSINEVISMNQEDWVTIIAPGQKGMYVDNNEPKEVKIITYRYTPQGLMYELESFTQDTQWLVKANCIQPVFGETSMLEVNLVTGKTRPSTS